MEKLKHYNDVIALGRLLVRELSLEQSVDTLGRWMAHHISELISDAEKAKGGKKSDAQDRCCEAVLALWKHVSVFPGGHRPLENIQPLLATIQALDPDSKACFFQSKYQSQIMQPDLSDEGKNWLELSHGIDYSARLLIGMCLKKVANEIATENLELLELTKSLDADIPITQVMQILADEPEKSKEEQEEKLARDTIQTLKNRQERLGKLVKLSELLASSIENDIKSIEVSLKK